MDESKPEEGLFPGKSALSAGIVLLVSSAAFASAANKTTPLLASGIFVCGAFLCAAGSAWARRRKGLAPGLILAGIAAGTLLWWKAFPLP